MMKWVNERFLQPSACKPGRFPGFPNNKHPEILHDELKLKRRHISASNVITLICCKPPVPALPALGGQRSIYSYRGEQSRASKAFKCELTTSRHGLSFLLPSLPLVEFLLDCLLLLWRHVDILSTVGTRSFRGGKRSCSCQVEKASLCMVNAPSLPNVIISYLR